MLNLGSLEQINEDADEFDNNYYKSRDNSQVRKYAPYPKKESTPELREVSSKPTTKEGRNVKFIEQRESSQSYNKYDKYRIEESSPGISQKASGIIPAVSP